MKLGVCKDTCAPGVDYYVAGREYMVDENDRFIARHFEFPDDGPIETPAHEEPTESAAPEAPKKRKIPRK